MGVPAETVNAAWAEAPESRRHICHGGTEIAEISRSDLRRMLEAAAPLIAAAERSKVQHAIDRVAQTAAAAQEKAVAAAVAAERERCADLLETAWGVIANAGWDDCAKSPGWQEAAERWRDSYHRWLANLGIPAGAAEADQP